METRYFCTLFDSSYLLKGLAMLGSLEQWCPSAHVYVLCMDNKTLATLTRLGMTYITCIPLSAIEDESILAVKESRSVAEYCWTLSPCLPWYVLHNNANVNFITYLDADLFFYSSVEPLFDEIGMSSVAIIEHRFPPRLEDRLVNGRFCVEWVSFRRDSEGLTCLSRWREQCIDWCFYRLENGRMGDQKYLDEWPDLYPSCHVLQNLGAGIAPWNYASYVFDQNDTGGIIVEGVPLIFYHFHQFQLLENGGFDRLSDFYRLDCPEPNLVYQTYESALNSNLNAVRLFDSFFSDGLKPVVLMKNYSWLQKIKSHFIKKASFRFFIQYFQDKCR